MSVSSAFPIALVATFTADECVEQIQSYAKRAAIAGSSQTTVTLGGFNQVVQSLLDPSSVFFTEGERGVNVALVRPRDVDTSPDGFSDLVKALQSYHANTDASRVVVIMVVPQSGHKADGWGKRLSDAVANCSKVLVVPTPEIVRCVGGSWQDDLYDPDTDRLGAMPYTVEGYRRLSIVVVRVVSYLTRVPTKVVAVDCDNTLWRGVAGDTGGAQAVVGNLALMKLLKTRKDQHGWLLCTFSKNAEDDVRAAFAAHSEWPLDFDRDFVSHYVNWDPKPDNLRKCAEELNLGLDSFVFLDDNPVEIAQVRQLCPAVVSLHVPNTAEGTAEQAEIDAFAHAAWPLDAFRSAVSEDAAKTEQYKAEQKRRADAAGASGAQASATFADFISGLDLNIAISECKTDEEIARVIQLSQKSNQFNFTTIRLTAMPANPSSTECTIVRVNDKYGDYGLVGVLFHHVENDTLVLQNLLMSCRVLGRGVEHAMIARLGKIALSKGVSSVEMRFKATDRNMPAGTFLRSVGFFPGGTDDKIQSETKSEGMMSKSFPAQAVSEVAFDPANISHYGAKQKSSSSSATAGTNGATLSVQIAADYTGIAREEARRATAATSTAETKTSEYATADVRAACLSALTEVLGAEASAEADADSTRSIYALGLDSLMMVRIFGKLKKRGVIQEKSTLTPTDLQRAATLEQWTELLSAPSSAFVTKNKSDQCMFKIKGSNAPGKASLVFLHPAGGAIGPFNKLFHALGEDREIWGIEHPYFVDESFHPQKHALGETGTVYADAIIEKLKLDDQPGKAGTSAKKWVLITFSAGGMWSNDTFHQLRMRGNAPHLVVVLDAGWGVMGRWDYPICCCGSCCCRLGCAPCPHCQPCASLCDGMFSLINCCWTPCQRSRYHSRNPSRNPDQPLTYNTM